MAKKKTESGEASDSREELDWNDERLAESFNSNKPLPDGIKIASPYGQSQVDVGSMRMVGEALGDDGNTGSSAASVPSGGANDA